MFDINSVRHIYFQGQYSLHFFPSFAVFSKFYSLLVILFLQPLPNFQSHKRVHHRFGGMRDWAILRGDTRDGD